MIFQRIGRVERAEPSGRHVGNGRICRQTRSRGDDIDPPWTAPPAGLSTRSGPQANGAGARVPDMGAPAASFGAPSDEPSVGHAPQGEAAVRDGGTFSAAAPVCLPR